MAEEVILQVDETTENTIELVTPDFSAFNTEALRWDLSMSNSIDMEDNLSISFVNIPTYNGRQLTKGMKIEIPIEGTGTIKMIVREIDYSLDAKSSSTTLLLATNKINLDTVISGGFVLDQEGPTPADAISAVAKKLGIPFDEIITDDLPWSVKKLVISGNQNVLAYFKKSFSNDQTPIYSFWIDAFNKLHVHHRRGTNSPAIEFDYLDIKRTLMSLGVRVFFSTQEKEVVGSPNLNEPKTSPMEEVPALEIKISGSEISGVSKTAVERKKRVSSSGEFQQESSALKKTLVNSQSIRMTFMGIDWYPVHSKAKLINFPLDDANSDDFVISNIILSQSDFGAPPTTTLILNTITENIPSLTNIDESDKNKNEQEKTSSLSVSIEDGSVGDVIEVLE